MLLAYFLAKNNSYNVICIDWRPLAKFQYFASAEYAIQIGQAIGNNLIKDILIDDLDQDPNLIHVIGHSMGAHLAGQIGKEVKDLQKLGRITGLDPANIGFEDKPTMLSKEDAVLVDVIHTNSGSFLDGNVGIEKPIGTIDFYPNGGKHMPGCKSEKAMSSFIGKLCQIIHKLLNTKCSHQMAKSYYEDSIRNLYDPKYFMSFECDSYVSFVIGDCKENCQLPMGEALTMDW